jgi:hypothetical protein
MQLYLLIDDGWCFSLVAQIRDLSFPLCFSMSRLNMNLVMVLLFELVYDNEIYFMQRRIQIRLEYVNEMIVKLNYSSGVDVYYHAWMIRNW